MKTIQATTPYIFHGINFKNQPFQAWKRLGGGVAKPHYPPRWMHGLFYRWELPGICQNSQVAKLRFVQPVSIRFDTFPDYAFFEVIPFVWDCWPQYFSVTRKWINRHRVKTAVFTSSQTAERMKEAFPQMNILFLPEAVNTEDYPAGRQLTDRTNQLYEIGQGPRCFLKSKYPTDYERLSDLPVKGLIDGKDAYVSALCNAKVTVTFPRCDLMPEETGGIETLTQRYWEAMLTRSVIVGRAPKELTDLTGYNPVVEIDRTDPIGQIEDILAHIGDYQSLVDQNRQTALAKGSWEIRIKELAHWLRSCGYECGIY